MSKDPRNIDPDDFFAETRMSFGDHIEDLRVHLWRAIKGFVLACVLGFLLGKPVLRFIAKPVEEQLQAFYDRRVEKVSDEIDTNDEYMKINKPGEWVRKGYSRKQLQLLREGKFDQLKDVEKPGDDDKIAELWERPQEPLKEVITYREAQAAIGKRPALSTLN